MFLAGLALGLAVIVAIAYLAWHTEPAWLMTAAIIGSTFNSNWGELGVPGGIAPDRLVLLAAILGLLLRSPGAFDRPRFRLEPIHAILAATLIWAIGSAIAAQTLSRPDTFFFLLDRLAVPFTVFALAPLAFRTPRHRAGFLAALVVFGGYLGLTAVFETFGPTALVIPHFIHDTGFQSDRAQGPFLEATVNGVALYTCAAAAAIAIATWTTRWKRVGAGFVLFLCALGLLFTLTRSVWIATVVATALTLALTPRLRRFLLPAAVASAAVVLLLLAVVPKFDTSVHERTHNQLTVWERRNVNAAAIEMVSRRPLTGFGIGTFNERNAEFFPLLSDVPQEVTVDTTQIAIHNVFLLFAVEQGLIGATLLVASLLAVVGSALLARGPPELRAWRPGLFALAAYWVVAANFAPLGQVFPNLIVWVWAGIVLGAATESERSPESIRQRAAWPESTWSSASRRLSAP
jgi:O-antigen ligase